MNSTYLKLSCTLGSIVLAFFLGYAYAYREYIIQNIKAHESIEYIDASTSTRNITIKNAPENIRFRVNGEIIHTGSIQLK